MSVLYVRNANGTFVQIPSIPGKSAYEIAVEKGVFEGTEQEFAEMQVFTNKEILEQITQENIDNWNSGGKGMTDEEREQLASKFDDVRVNEVESNDKQTALDFYANKELIKTIYFTGGSGSGGSTSAYISSTMAENIMVNIGENIELPIDFNSPNLGKGTLKVSINDMDVMSTSIIQGESTITISDKYLIKGTNRMVVYALDRVGQMSNSLTFYVRYGSTELTSDFNPYTSYDYGSSVRYYFTPSALDTSQSLTFYMSIDGEKQNGVTCTSDVRAYYTFPNNLSVDNHYCEAWVEDANGNKSTVLKFDLVIIDDTSLVIASDTKNPTVEEGLQLAIDYKVYMKNNISFITKTYVDNNLVNTGTCGLETAYYRTSSLTEGTHTIKIEVYNESETVSDSITWNVTVTPSDYEMLQPITTASLFVGTAMDKTNSDERKNVWVGVDQDNNEVLGDLHNFAYNSESGWVNDTLIISGNSYVEIPIQPLSENAKYGFTLDIEFLSKQIGVEDAEVLTLWDNDKNCGIKITTENLILRSAEGNECNLYFSDNEMTNVMFVIDRNEAKAKIYLNGVMCEAFHLSDYVANGISYLEDFTVNSNVILGGYNKNGYSVIKNLRIYEVALTTNEILNNFMANERDKTKQQQLVEFQKGNDLPTLTIYCDFSGLGKDDKKPCKIVYNSTDEVKYGKSFILDHKKSTCQYQGTSSMAYPIKNYRINLADENGEKWKYNFPNGKPEYRFTLKCDFMSSGHWQNTGFTKWVNDNLYHYDTSNEKSMNPKKWYDINNGGSLDDTRECIYGFPCRLILVNDGNTALNEGQNEPTPGNTKDMGIFNFNHDKDATDTMGFDQDVFPNCASYEISANSDTSAGAFISYDEVANSDVTELEYIKQSFELRFPDEKDVPEGWGFIGVDAGENEIRDLYYFYYPNVKMYVSQRIILEESTILNVQDGGTFSWVYFNESGSFGTNGNTIDNTSYKDISSTKYYSFSVRLTEENLSSIILINGYKYRFKNFVEDEVFNVNTNEVFLKDNLVIGDSVGVKPGLKALIDWVDNCSDEEFVRDFEQHFHKDYTLRYYLMVIVAGMVDNLGKNLMLDTWDNKIFMPRFYDCDTICSYDNSGDIKFDVDIEMEQGYWNTSSSRLWTRVRDLMHNDLVEKYNDMRQNGLSYESLMKCFYDEQIAKIPQKYYNMDYDVKYAPFADSYIGMAHGNGYEHLKHWLKRRLIFCDTLFDYAPSYNNDMLTIRANTKELMNIEIETYTPVYQHISWYNGQMDKKKIDGKNAVTFSGTAMTETDQEVLIYGGSNIKKISGITSMNPNQMLIGSATRLSELSAPNCPLLADINSNKANLSPHTYLNKVDLSNCPQLGGALRLNNSQLIQDIDISGTTINGLQLPPSVRNLEKFKLSEDVANVILRDAVLLEELNIPTNIEYLSLINVPNLTKITSNANSYDKLKSLIIENTTINPFTTIINNKAPNLESVRLMGIDVRIDYGTMKRVQNFKGLDLLGNEVPLKEALSGKIAITQCSEKIIAQLEEQFPLVEFSVISIATGYTVKFLDGDDKTIYETTVFMGESVTYEGKTPTKTSTAQYDYEFEEWNIDISKPIIGNLTIRALFKEVLRYYNITFQLPGTLEIVDVISVAYGELPPQPSNMNRDLYDGWTPDLVAVTGEAIYTAKPLPYPSDFGCFEFTLENDYYICKVLDVNSLQEKLIIPKTYNEIPIKIVIGVATSTYKKNVRSIYVPYGVEVIGENAFYGMSYVNELTLPETITTVGKKAFYEVSSYGKSYVVSHDIYLPNLVSIDEYSFYYFNSKSSSTKVGFIILPNTITELPKYSFYNSKVKLTSNITTINEYSLYSAKIRGSLSGITTIKDNATYDNTKYYFEDGDINAIVTLDSMTSAYGSENNKRFIINNKPIHYPNVTEIDLNSFINIYDNKTIILGSNSNPFKRISGKSSISFTGYDRYNLISLVLITENGKRSDILVDELNTSFDNYNIPELTITKNIPRLVTQKDISADSDSSALIIDETYAIWKGTGNSSNVDTNITIPSSIDNIPITMISSGSLYNLTKGISLTIPEGITHIGEEAFYSLTKAKNIILPSTLKSIGDQAFYNWGSGNTDTATYPILSSLTSNIEYIGNYAFAYAKQLSGNVIISGLVKRIGSYAFAKTGINSVVIQEGTKVIESCAFYNCTSLTDVTLPESIEQMNEVFVDCTNLTTAYIPSSVTTIYEYPYKNCGATEVYIPSQVTTLRGNYDYQLFDNYLKTPTIIKGLEGITTIQIGGPNAKSTSYSYIYNATALTYIEFPSLTTLVDGANKGTSTTSRPYMFYGLTNTTTIQLGAPGKPITDASGWKNYMFNKNCTCNVIIYTLNGEASDLTGSPWGGSGLTSITYLKA